MLWGGFTVKHRWLAKSCLVLWLAILAVQALFIANTPDSVVIRGVDMSAVTTAGQVRVLTWIAMGVALGCLSFVPDRRTQWLIVASCLVYLWGWFPLGSVRMVGFAKTFEVGLLLTPTPMLKVAMILRNAIAPIGFAVVTMFALRGIVSRNQA
jgi:hypothetical protein